MYDFSNHITIVTGGASGIGRATARIFAGYGSKVVIADRDLEGARRVAEELGDSALAVEVDVTQEESVAALVASAESHFGGVTIMVNNAGISSPKSPIENASAANYDKVLAVNLRGVFLGSKHAAPAIRRAGGGSILNTSSVAAIYPRKESSIYAASKSAVIAMTRSLAVELAPDIRVNCVCPSIIDTDFMKTLVTDEASLVELRRRIHANPEMQMPMAMILEPEDVAHAYAFLASDHARGIAGVALPIDGARSAGDAS